MTRKRCEAHWSELAYAVCLLIDSAKTRSDIEKAAIELILEGKLICCNVQAYIEDLNYKSRTNKEIEKYIASISRTKKFTGIEKVWLSGKSLKNYPELQGLHMNANRKESKADVFFKQRSGAIVGISIKASHKCPLTNYSVEKLLPSGQLLSELKFQYLGCLGINKDAYNTTILQGTAKEKRKLRDIVNPFFYRSNIYFRTMHNEIMKHKKHFVQNIVDNMYPDLNYELYEFNGDTLSNLKTMKNCDINIERYFPTKVNKTKRNAAKRWYKIHVDNITFNCEIRFKGTHFASPQILAVRE